MHDLLQHARDGIARAGVASEWLAVFAQERRPDGWWLSRDEVLADDARIADELIDASARATPAVDRRLLWRGVPSQVAWPLGATTAGVLEATGRLLRIDPEHVRLRVATGDHGAGIDGVWFSRVDLTVAPGDALAGSPAPGVRVADRTALTALLVADLVAYMEPVIELVRARGRYGARGLWGSVADCALPAWAESRPADDGPGDRRARVAAFMAACAGTPLAHPVRWTGFEHSGEQHAAMRYCACCLAYRWPGDPDAAPRPDGLDRTWDRYCLACPLVPDAEVVHRSRHWLDHEHPGH